MTSAPPSQGRYLAPRIIQAVGLLLIAAAFVFWAITERESTLFVGVGMSMVLLGGYDRAKMDLTTAIKSRDAP